MTEVWSKWQVINVSGNGLTLSRWQAIAWSQKYPVHWHFNLTHDILCLLTSVRFFVAHYIYFTQVSWQLKSPENWMFGQRKHQSSTLLDFSGGNAQVAGGFPYKWPVMWKVSPCLLTSSSFSWTGYLQNHCHRWLPNQIHFCWPKWCNLKWQKRCHLISSDIQWRGEWLEMINHRKKIMVQFEKLYQYNHFIPKFGDMTCGPIPRLS